MQAWLLSRAQLVELLLAMESPLLVNSEGSGFQQSQNAQQQPLTAQLDIDTKQSFLNCCMGHAGGYRRFFTL